MASELTLSLLIGTVQPQPVPREVMESLVSASVTVSATEKSGFDLSFAVSTGSPLLTDLLPSGYFDPPTRVILVVTMSGTSTVLMDGVITLQEMVPSDEPGKSVLSIKGDDLTRMLDVIDLSGFPWPAMPAEARVALAVAKYLPLYGIVPLIIPSVLIDVPNPLTEIPQQEGTDLTYIKSLAANVGYVFFIQPGPLPGMNLAYWGPKLGTAIPFLPTPPPIAIDWDGASNVESLQFSFDGFAKTQWIVWIQIASIPIPIPVPDINPINPPLGLKSPLPLKISPMPGLAKYSPIQAAGIALAKAASTANVISGQGTLDVLRYGSILPARTVVEVRGRHHLRRRVFRRQHDSHDQAGVLQAELHPQPQCPDRQRRQPVALPRRGRAAAERIRGPGRAGRACPARRGGHRDQPAGAAAVRADDPGPHQRRPDRGAASLAVTADLTQSDEGDL